MENAHADRNMLFGIMALQLDFIDKDALVRAMNAWVLDKGQTLGQVLIAQERLAEDEHALLEALVQKHLQKHGNDPQQSLAAVSSAGPAHRELEQITDPDVQASLAHLPTAPPTGGDPHATAFPASAAVAPAPNQAGQDPHGTVYTPGAEAGGKGPEDSHATRFGTVGAPSAVGLRFRILRSHAKGGLGQVSVALDGELRREVALKEIQQRFAHDAESRARFLLEAEVTGGLEHPGIVPVYGLGQYADGRPFYAMRLIRGDSLKEAVASFHQAEQRGRPAGEGLLELRRMLGRFLDVCHAIEYAHSRGVLHRDLKPGNVMLGPCGETLVVDWGLAKALGRGDAKAAVPPLQPSLSGDSTMTQAGEALGTPAYMSPEQAAGRLDQLGPASDVYSLGATLYHLLTGRAPVAGQDVAEVLRRAQRGEFPRPREVKRDAPPALEAVCLKAMALRLEDRYGSPRALAEDVERWLADEPIGAWAEPWSMRARRWIRRHGKLVTAATCVTVLAVLFLGVLAAVLGAAGERERQARQLAEQREEEARLARRQAEMDRDEALRGRHAAVELVARLTEGIETPALDPQFYQELILEAFDQLPAFPFKDAARGLLRDNPKVIKVVMERVTGHVLQRARELITEGEELQRDGKHSTSLALYGRAISILTVLAARGKEPGNLQATLCSAHEGRATSYEFLGRYKEALGDWDLAIDYAREERRGGLRLDRALCLMRMGRRAEALKAVPAWGSSGKSARDEAEARRLVRLHALAADSVAVDRSLTPAEREKQCSEHATIAAKWLRAGIPDREKAARFLATDPDLPSMRSRPEFTEWATRPRKATP
jgi:serine/threonine protein kinase